jgi:antitoxin component HigA of HigAB toxin-antitoxin module
MMQLETITKNWEALHQAQLHPITTEVQYTQMLDFMHNLMRGYDVTLEPHKSLWRLASQYIIEWESANDDVAFEPIQGFEILRALADAQDSTQAEFAAKLEIDQSHLSRILRGERRISRKLAARAERIFRVPADTLLKV